MGLGLGTSNTGERLPMHPAVTWSLPSTGSWLSRRAGVPPLPSYRVTPHQSHASMVWNFQGESNGGAGDGATGQQRREGSKHRTHRDKHVSPLCCTTSQGFSSPHRTPSLPSRQCHQPVWSQAQQCHSIHRLQQCPCRLVL